MELNSELIVGIAGAVMCATVLRLCCCFGSDAFKRLCESGGEKDTC